MVILGINGALGFDGNQTSSYVHGAGATLIVDGQLVGAASQERFTRRKYDGNFPDLALQSLLSRAGLTSNDVDHVAYVTNLALIDHAHAQRFLQSQFARAKLVTVNHHLAHASASFYTSGWDNSLVFTLDAAGDREHYNHYTNSTLSVMTAQGTVRKLYNSYNSFNDNPDWINYFSLGDFYNDVSMMSIGLAVGQLPFRESAAGRAMGLAALGHADLVDLPNPFRVVQPTPWDLPVILVQRSHYMSLAPVLEQHQPGDIMAWAQQVFEQTLEQYFQQLPDWARNSRLCLGGGCALNILANSRLARSGMFERVWINPAPNDDGLALGAALWAAQGLEQQPVTLPANLGCLGAEYSDAEIMHEYHTHWSQQFQHLHGPDADTVGITARLLADHRLVAWFQGRSEYGPRALGNRSILANPTRDLRQHLNHNVKYREPWRPYAAMVLEHSLDQWFDAPTAVHHYMLFAAHTRDPRALPGVTHHDGTCRVQTVNSEINAKATDLLSQFHALTGVPVLLNTSFNTQRGEPIVESPRDAFASCANSGVDYLVMGRHIFKPHATPHHIRN
jgi:carbamoyltransferase